MSQTTKVPPLNLARPQDAASLNRWAALIKKAVEELQLEQLALRKKTATLTAGTNYATAASVVAASGGASGVQVGGDIGGTNASPTVVGLQTIPLSAVAPSSGQMLQFNSTSGKWEPVTFSGGSGVPSVDGITTAVTLSAGTGISITDNSPSAGDIEIASTVSAGVPSVDGITSAVTLSPGAGITITDNSPAAGDIELAGSVFGASGTSHASGDVPDPGATAGTTRYLREDATWDVPSGGGGGGASVADKFVVYGSNSDLTGEKVVPYLSQYDPRIAPATPSSYDDEFAEGSLSSQWTSYGTGAVDAVTYNGYLRLFGAVNADFGVYESYAPGAVDFSAAIRIRGYYNAEYALGGIQFQNSSGGNILDCTLAIGSDSSADLIARVVNGGTETDVRLGPIQSWRFLFDQMYILVQRTSAGVWTVYFSQNGLEWLSVYSGSNSTAIARLALHLNPVSTSLSTALSFDFVRVFSSITSSIGKAP